MRAWLDERGLVIRARGTTGDEEAVLERVCYRYERDGLVGWIALDGIRNEQGGFKKRQDLRNVPKLGKKVFEQAAGFLRIRGGEQPLDNSAVHPESYYIVEKMAAALQLPTRQLVGNSAIAGIAS